VKELHLNNDFLPDDCDPVIDEHLQSLGHFSPAPDFADRVMARVQLPAPALRGQVKARGRSFVASRRLRWWARALAGASVISVTIVAAFAVTNAAAVSAFVTARFGGVVLAAWRTVLGLASAAALELYALVGAGAWPGLAVTAMACLAAATLLFNAWALYRLMQPPGPPPIRALP
jgi:hypothetical protein